MRDRLLQRAAWAERRGPVDDPAGPQAVLRHPLGLQVRDPRVRRREEAVRRLLEEGVLRGDELPEALLQISPEDFLSEAEVADWLADRVAEAPEGTAAPHLGLRTTSLALAALDVQAGQRACDLLATRGHVAALLAALVGPTGSVVAVCPGPWRTRRALLGAALPRSPEHLRDAITAGGRLVAIVGPRFRAQDLLCFTRADATLRERLVARVRAPVLAGPGGWLQRPRRRVVG